MFVLLPKPNSVTAAWSDECLTTSYKRKVYKVAKIYSKYGLIAKKRFLKIDSIPLKDVIIYDNI